VNRRRFIKNTAKIAACGLIVTAIPGCIESLDSLLGDDHISLRNGKTWTSVQNLGILGSGPTVIKESGTYKMWYTDNAASPTNMNYVTSSNGLNWSTPVIVFTRTTNSTVWDDTYLFNPSVIKLNSTYKMWYQASKGLLPADKSIIYCESSDGINWSNFQTVITSSVSIPAITYIGAAVPVVIYANGQYKMWLIIENYLTSNIIYCDSFDGINWSNFQRSLPIGLHGTYDNTSVISSGVILDGNLYKIWYSGFDGTTWRILYSESHNGINWFNPQLSINLSPSSTSKTTVINDKGVGLMWFFNAATNTIWYAESR